MKTRPKRQHLTLNIQFTLVIVALFLNATARNAMAGKWEFAPRYIDYSGEMVLKGIIDGRETESYNRSRSYRNINFQEFLHVNGSGFSYSPNLVSFLSDISIGLQQESRETDVQGYRVDNGMFGFRQQLMILPNHPYNLHLYAGRSDDLVGGQAGGTSRALNYHWGARANYLKRPWQTALNYKHSASVSAWESVTDSMGMNLYYFDTLTFWNSSVGYNHYMSSSYDNQSNSVKDLFAAHISKKWDSFRFLSKWNVDQRNQEAHYQYILDLPDYSETRTRWEWFNEAAADLPLNVTSNLSYRKRNNDSEYQRENLTGRAISDTDTYNLNFIHHLYKSLITNLNSGYRTTESAGGKTEQKDASLGTGYSKVIRWGNIGASLSGGITDTGNVGGTTTLSENHFLTASSPTSFTLNGTQLDPDTIRVSVIDAFNNNMVVPLIRDIHYTVIFLGESYRILLLAPPPSLTEPWTEYTYNVDYSNFASDYSMRGRNWGGTLRMGLFNQLLSPHAGYSQNDQQALTGFFPGILDNSTSYSVGLSSTYGLVQGDLTKQWKISSTESETRLNGYVTASLKVTQLTGGSCTLSYENGTIEQLYAGSSDRELALDENIYASHVQAFTSWPESNLRGTLGVSYSLYQGLGKSSTRSINSGLTWHIGKLDIDMRLAYHDSESEVLTSTSISSYYSASFMLRRQLF